jgi:restriction system protein
MKNYYRVMLGRKSKHAPECFANGFIGTDFGIYQDLSAKLSDEWRAFNKEYIPVFLAEHPDKTKIGAGLACGALWTVSKGIKTGDVVLSPDGDGTYRVGEVISDYAYAAGQILPHRRRVRWLDTGIARDAMSEALQHSTGSIGTVADISEYREELSRLLGEASASTRAVVPAHVASQDPVAFAMEKHLEEFLVKHWRHTELGAEFDILEDEGQRVGQQYQTDTGPLDILAISKDKKRLLVIELKRGCASDDAVGQVLRYVGFVQEQPAFEGKQVEGLIVAADCDKKLQWALKATPNVSFQRYELDFKLVKA